MVKVNCGFKLVS